MEGYQGWALHCLENRWTAKAVGVRFYHPSSKLCIPNVMAAWQSPKLFVGVRVPGGTPNMDSSVLGTSWFAKPVYFEKGNSSILFLSSRYVGVAEWSNATVCKIVKPSVRIWPPIPSFICRFSWCGHSTGLKHRGMRFDPSRRHHKLWGILPLGCGGILFRMCTAKHQTIGSTPIFPAKF